MITLRDKFRGCIAATWIGSSMGAAVEGWSPEKIKETHGFVDKLLTYKHYADYTDWQRKPGTTEDGIERQRLMATAIIEKQDRISARDYVDIWLKYLTVDRIRFKQEPFDQSLLEMAQAGVPPEELGKMWIWPNIISMARASHPVALINAGDPRGAADDTYEVGKVYAREASFTLRWAALYNAALAEACKPNATVESVLQTARDFANYRKGDNDLFGIYDFIAHEIDHALTITQQHSDWEAMRDEFYQHYTGGNYVTYGMSQANEIVAKGLALFAFTKGNPKEAILLAVNFGRDTDCLAAVASGLAGALSGPSALPQEWIDQVNEATQLDPYTNSNRSIEETAGGLFEAFLARRKRLDEYLKLMGEAEFLA